MQQTTEVLRHLRALALARAVFVVDDVGDVVAFDGEPDILTSDLGDLAVARLGGVDELLRQVGESEAGVLFHEIPGQDIYLSRISGGLILGVLFDQHRTSLGAVRLTVKTHREQLARAVEREQ